MSNVTKGDYIAFFGSELGRKIMTELQHRFLTSPTYTRGDPMHTAYLEGRRAAVQWLAAKADPSTEVNEDAETEKGL